MAISVPRRERGEVPTKTLPHKENTMHSSEPVPVYGIYLNVEDFGILLSFCLWCTTKRSIVVMASLRR